MGNRVAIGMHKIYLTFREYRDCFKGKFWCSLLLSFYLEAIYLPLLKISCQSFQDDAVESPMAYADLSLSILYS